MALELSDFYFRVDEIGISERAKEISSRSIKKSSKLNAIKLSVSMIDLTTLEGKDSECKVMSVCNKAINPLGSESDFPHVAAVCVYPNMIKNVKKFLNGSGVKIASVATAFPSGQSPVKVKLDEVRRAIEFGADEIDMVISRGRFLEGDHNFVTDEISKVKEVCKNKLLKVILETGELETLDNVRKASIIAMIAGADFIKTSTGKVQPAATLPVTLVMLEAIRDYYDLTGLKIGMKPAGGIRTTKDSISYLSLVYETLGEKWLTPELFRIGASTLLNDLLMQFKKQKESFYQSINYFSND